MTLESGAFPVLVLLRALVFGVLWALLLLLLIAVILLRLLLRRLSIAAYVPYVPGAWFAGRALVTLAIPAVIAAWALWVILSDKRQVSTESAT